LIHSCDIISARIFKDAFMKAPD